ncbi:unnamed protein product [Brassica rapa subsp. trilocularis]
MSIKSKGTTQKQQRIFGYAIQLSGPLCMFFDEDVYALEDLKFILRLIHLCKSVKHSSELKTPSLCIRKPPLFTVVTNQLSPKQTKRSLDNGSKNISKKSSQIPIF